MARAVNADGDGRLDLSVFYRAEDIEQFQRLGLLPPGDPEYAFGTFLLQSMARACNSLRGHDGPPPIELLDRDGGGKWQVTGRVFGDLATHVSEIEARRA